MPLFLEEAVPPELGHFKVSDLHYKLTHIQKPHGNGSALPNFGRFYRRATATTGVSMKGFNQKRDCQKYYL